MPESAQLSKTAKAKHGCRVAAVAALLVACICAVVVAALSGGYYVANTPGSFLLATPPPTIPPSTLTVAQNWPIAFSDSFHSNANAWNVSDTQPETNSSGSFAKRSRAANFALNPRRPKVFRSSSGPRCTISPIFI